jgi:DNA invertase Pin-like site-specific DNA recombinase
MELGGLLRPGRPINPENTDRIRELLESERCVSQNTLSRRLNLQHNIVHRILAEELGLSKVNFKWISRSGRESHKQKPVRISIELFPFLEESSRQKLAHALNQE